MENLPEYAPSERMLKAFKSSFSDGSLASVDPKIADYMKTRRLNKENVCIVLSALLSIEDIKELDLYRMLTQLNIKGRDLELFCIPLSPTKVRAKDVLNPNLDEIIVVPKTNWRASEYDILSSFIEREHFCFKVESVTNSKVTFVVKISMQETKEAKEEQLEKFLKKHAEINFDAIFRSPRIPARLMYQALDKLKASPKTLDYLFPTKSTKPSAAHQIYRIKLDTSSLYNSSIATNGEQLQAVHQILNGLSPHEPYIIIGPPGTGKTTTIAEAILQLYFQGDNRILVTAGSNSACDTIALRLCEIFSTHHKLSEMREQCNLKWTMELKHRYMDAHKLKGVLNKKWVESLKTLRLFALSFNMSSVDPKLKEHFVCQTSAQTRALGSFKLIVATLCTVGRMVVSGCGHFSHVFIDEAAASSEPEALMGIMGTRGDDGHIILSGDHKQLSAVIKSERAAALGLEQSLMERLMLCEAYAVDEKGNYDHALQARLRRNYRSHPAIVGIYNKLYYNNELIALAPLGQVSQAANWKVLPNREYPVLFHAVQGETRREKNSTSSFNELEASLVYSYVMHLMRNGLGGGVMVKQEDIGVVTPYVAQCRLLSRSLSERGQRQVEVGSVEKYQGREKLIIIASLVSSFTSARFITNPKRMNVFLSRAKSLLIMIGNPLTLSQNADFKFIIEQCKLKGNYVTGNEVQ